MLILDFHKPCLLCERLDDRGPNLQTMGSWRLAPDLCKKPLRRHGAILAAGWLRWNQGLITLAEKTALWN
jgi:hypothetical protein